MYTSYDCNAQTPVKTQETHMTNIKLNHSSDLENAKNAPKELDWTMANEVWIHYICFGGRALLALMLMNCSAFMEVL